jgi:VWFA-related protein
MRTREGRQVDRPGRRRIAAALSLLLWLAGPAPAWARAPLTQEEQSASPAQDPVQFDSTVDVVSIQISVADQAGLFVAGLGPEDFLLEIDGVARPVTAAYAVDARAASLAPADLTVAAATTGALAVGATGSRPPAARRHFLVFVDLTTMDRIALRNARDSARRFVADYSAPADMIGMAIYSPIRGLDYLVPFTTDHSLTLDTLDTLQAGRAGEAIAEIGDGIPLADLAAALESAGTEFLTEMEMTRVEMQAENTLNAMRELIRTMATIEGRKHLLLFSRGLPDLVVEDPGGRAALISSTDVAGESGVVVHTFQPDNLPGSGLHDIRVSTPGANTGGSRFRILRDRQVMASLAGETGGTSWLYRHSMNDGLEKVEESTRNFYVLAFRVLPEDADKVAVEVRVRRPEVSVTWAPGDFILPSRARAMTDAERQFRIAEALQIGTDLNEIEMDLLAAPVEFDPEGDGKLALVATVPAQQVRALLEERGDGGLSLEMFGMAVTPWGTVMDYFRSRLDMPAGTLDLAVETPPFRYYNLVVVPPGRYYVKLLIREQETGLLTSKGVTFDVPSEDPGNLRASTPVFVVPPDRAQMMRGVEPDNPPVNRVGKDLAYPFVVSGRELIPDRLATVPPGHEGWVYVRAENVALHPSTGDPGLSISGMLMRPDGMPMNLAADDVIAAELEPGTEHIRLLIHYRLPDTIVSGAYSLNFDVRDHVVGERVQVSVPITVLEQ